MHRLRRRGVRHHHDVRLHADQRDRREVGDRVVAERGVEKAVGRVRHRGDEERVAVGLGLGDRLGADIGAGAGLVLDHDLLAPDLGEPMADDAGDRVGGAAGHERNDEPHVPAAAMPAPRRRAIRSPELSADAAASPARRRRVIIGFLPSPRLGVRAFTPEFRKPRRVSGAVDRASRLGERLLRVAASDNPAVAGASICAMGRRRPR